MPLNSHLLQEDPILKTGDIVRTVTAVTSIARAQALPKGITGIIGRKERTEVIDGEVVDVFLFHPGADYPGVWAVTEFHVKLLKRPQ